MRLTEDKIEAGRSPKGGWTRAQLASWGVPWPPPHGWRKRLTSGKYPDVPNYATPQRIRFRMKTKASDFPNIPFAKFYFREPFSSSMP
jgi:hypothetical protein